MRFLCTYFYVTLNCNDHQHKDGHNGCYSCLMRAVICSLVGPSMTLMPVMYDLAILCKTGWLLATIATIMSVFMLVIIAIQRYIKVCTQKAHIVTLKWKRFMMILAQKVQYNMYSTRCTNHDC
jgi:hypothetical protein